MYLSLAEVTKLLIMLRSRKLVNLHATKLQHEFHNWSTPSLSTLILSMLSDAQSSEEYTKGAYSMRGSFYLTFVRFQISISPRKVDYSDSLKIIN